jgi:sterol desaturase/sphingolipid hydroxylase (fatty acid hydroxylase superfamily)
VSPFLEYAWHSRVAHGKRPHVTRDSHLEHHRTAYDVLDPWVEMRENAGRVARTLVVVNGVLAPIIGLASSLAVSAGLVGGYIGSTLYHAQMHRRAPRTRYEAWMWRFHWHHHVADVHVNFGLTNPVFDFVFGTAVVPEQVEVPEKLAPAWLRELPAPRGGFGMRVRSPRPVGVAAPALG